jgi:nicotinic acid mononucleotide adenylyltransferase
VGEPGLSLEKLRRESVPRLELLDGDGQPSSAALLSGSFDPVTTAHVALAQAALSVAEVAVLVYSVHTMPKEGTPPPPLLSEEERVAALIAVCRSHPGLLAGVCSHGLLVDQASAARTAFPGARLWMVMGSDKVLQLLEHKWYADRDASLRALFSDAEVLYAERNGEEGAVGAILSRPQNRSWAGRFRRLDVPTGVADLSSTHVRRALEEGEDVGGLIPPEVASILASRRHS